MNPELRKCKECGLEKELKDYYIIAGYPRRVCKECHNRKSLQHKREIKGWALDPYPMTRVERTIVEEIQKDYYEGMGLREIASKYAMSYHQIKKWPKKGILIRK